MKNSLFPIIFFFLLLSTFAQSQQKEKEIMDSANVTEADISNTLKQTLKMGVDEGVKELKKPKAFKKSQGLFKENVPTELKKVDEKLDDSGFSNDLNSFENDLSKGIAQAVKDAEPIFDAAINQINFTDAFRILMGGKNEATQYLQSTAGKEIEEKLGPIIQRTLTASGAMDKYGALLSEYQKLTGETVDFNLVNYLAGEVTNNMFKKIGEEEAKIRLNAYLWKNVVFKNVFGLQKKAHFNTR